LKNALSVPSRPRAIRSGSSSISAVKKVPADGASSSRPTTIQSRRNHSFRSKSWIAGSW
jgi:hypothetical protein